MKGTTRAVDASRRVGPEAHYNTGTCVIPLTKVTFHIPIFGYFAIEFDSDPVA